MNLKTMRKFVSLYKAETDFIAQVALAGVSHDALAQAVLELLPKFPGESLSVAYWLTRSGYTQESYSNELFKFLLQELDGRGEFVAEAFEAMPYLTRKQGAYLCLNYNPFDWASGVFQAFLLSFDWAEDNQVWWAHLYSEGLSVGFAPNSSHLQSIFLKWSSDAERNSSLASMASSLYELGVKFDMTELNYRCFDTYRALEELLWDNPEEYKKSDGGFYRLLDAETYFIRARQGIRTSRSS